MLAIFKLTVVVVFVESGDFFIGKQIDYCNVFFGDSHSLFSGRTFMDYFALRGDLEGGGRGVHGRARRGVDVAAHVGRVPDHDRVRGDVLRHDRARADHRVRPDRDADLIAGRSTKDDSDAQFLASLDAIPAADEPTGTAR